jgi:hypothetical protein
MNCPDDFRIFSPNKFLGLDGLPLIYPVLDCEVVVVIEVPLGVIQKVELEIFSGKTRHWMALCDEFDSDSDQKTCRELFFELFAYLLSIKWLV